MNRKLFRKISEEDFNKLTRKVIDYVMGELPRVVKFDDVWLNMDLTNDQILIICQIGEDFIFVNNEKAHDRGKYGKDISDLEISVIPKLIPEHIVPIDETTEIEFAIDASKIDNNLRLVKEE